MAGNDYILRKAPFLVVILRILLTPFFLFFYLGEFFIFTIVVYIMIILSDIIDGYLARRFGVKPTSPLESYLDPVADFLFVIAAFSAFSFRLLYPLWLVIVLFLMFIFFLLTSNTEEPIYDPIGKYFGIFLMGTIGITLVINFTIVLEIVLLSILLYTVVLLVTRCVFILKKREDKNLYPFEKS